MASQRRQHGFTLLEVLVALVIVALGLLAAFGQVNQTLTVASRIREKTIANWVAANELTRIRLLGEFPAISTRSDEVEMGRINWRYTIKVVKTQVNALRRIDVSVAMADRPDTVVTTLTGFAGQPPAGAAVPPPEGEAGWEPLGDTGP